VKLSEVCRLGGGGGGKEEEKLNVWIEFTAA
jgi:hypothetical protein